MNKQPFFDYEEYECEECEETFSRLKLSKDEEEDVCPLCDNEVQ